MIATPPLIISRAPTRSASRPEKGEVTTKAAAEGVRAMPAATGSRTPRLSHTSGSKNSMPYMPKVMPAVAATAPRNGRMANIGSGTRAASRPASMRMNTVRAAAATNKAAAAMARS